MGFSRELFGIGLQEWRDVVRKALGELADVMDPQEGLQVWTEAHGQG